MKNIKIITLADKEYLSFLRPFIVSCRKNFKEASLYVVIVNSPEKEVVKLENLHPSIDIRVENKEFKDEFEKRCYCTNRRAFLFRELRNSTNDILLWIDADSIIRKKCDFLIEHLNSCELTMRRKKRADKFAAGVIGIGSTPICKEFIEYYYRLVEADNSWMSNQIHLREAYLEFQDRICFEYLPREYCNVWLDDEGVIWTAKSKKKEQRRYLKEMRKYNV